MYHGTVIVCTSRESTRDRGKLTVSLALLHTGRRPERSVSISASLANPTGHAITVEFRSCSAQASHFITNPDDRPHNGDISTFLASCDTPTFRIIGKYAAARAAKLAGKTKNNRCFSLFCTTVRLESVRLRQL